MRLLALYQTSARLLYLKLLESQLPDEKNFGLIRVTLITLCVKMDVCATGYAPPMRRTQETAPAAAAAAAAPEAERAPPAEAPADRWRPSGQRTEAPRSEANPPDAPRPERTAPTPAASGGSFVPRCILICPPMSVRGVLGVCSFAPDLPTSLWAPDSTTWQEARPQKRAVSSTNG